MDWNELAFHGRICTVFHPEDLRLRRDGEKI